MEEIKLPENETTAKVGQNHSTAILVTAIVIAALTLVCSFVILAVLESTPSVSEREYLTYENYLKIQNGMTYNEVVEIFDGHEGNLDSSAGFGDYSLEYYDWTNSSYSIIITIGFENGCVCAKSQIGLQ